MQPGLSLGLNKNQCFTAEEERSSNVNSRERRREREGIFFPSSSPLPVFLKLQNRVNPARHRRHTPTHADTAGRLPASPAPQRGFDHTEAFMGNDWRMHPLLSLQIYLTESTGEGRGWRRWRG